MRFRQGRFGPKSTKRGLAPDFYEESSNAGELFVSLNHIEGKFDARRCRSRCYVAFTDKKAEFGPRQVSPQIRQLRLRPGSLHACAAFTSKFEPLSDSKRIFGGA